MLENPVSAEFPSANTIAAPERPQVPLRVDAGAVVESEFALTQFQDQAGDIMSRGLPLSVTITGLARQAEATTCLRQVCSGIAATAYQNAMRPADIEIVITASALLPDEAWAIRSRELGCGPLYLLAGERELRVCPDDSKRFRRFWEGLWRLQPNPHLRLACAPWVRSCCPLLAHETGTTVLPQSALQAPSGTAWITRTINLRRFADANGLLDRTRLRTELQRSVVRGLARHERTAWPNASLRHDSWLNRRLAIYITGIGDLVLRRRQDPRQLACLANLRNTLRWIQSILSQQSRQIAVAGEVLPAIGQFDPAQTLGVDRERWEARWSAAINEHASCSRNLVVMSPWSVFPTLTEPEPAYLNLLPLLAFADACAFPEPPKLRGWNIKNFMQLHQRTWAILERRGGAQLFAEQV